MMHFHGEHLSHAWIRCGVRGQEQDLLAGFDLALLHSPSEDIADTFDFVDARDGHAHWCTYWPLRHTAEIVQHIVQSVHVHRAAFAYYIHAAPPGHLVGLFQEIVTHPTRDWENWCVFFNEILLPTDLHQHAHHLVFDFIVAVF